MALPRGREDAQMAMASDILPSGAESEEAGSPGGFPVFSGDSYSRSPFTISDDFIQFLFDDYQSDDSTSIISANLNLEGYSKYGPALSPSS
jgi:hypothetical protein